MARRTLPRAEPPIAQTFVFAMSGKGVKPDSICTRGNYGWREGNPAPFLFMWRIDLQTAEGSSNPCPRFRASKGRAKNTCPRLAYSGILPEARNVVAERAMQRPSRGVLMANVGQQTEVMQYH